MRASRCLCASVTVARLYGLSSSVPKPGIHMFQLRSEKDIIKNIKPMAQRAELKVHALTQMQLNVFHLDFGNFTVLCQQTGSVHRVFNEIIGDLKQKLFDLFVQLLGWIDFTDQFLQTWFREYLQWLSIAARC